MSRVTGVPTADEFWQHWDYDTPCGTQAGGLTEIQRGANLGATGWALGITYKFSFEFTSTALKVYVDGVEEISIGGTFSDGRLAFYNFSQAGVEYSGFEVVPFEPEINIKPGSDPNSINLCSGGKHADHHLGFGYSRRIHHRCGSACACIRNRQDRRQE